ncbi:hypothetical protein CHS0354_009184 [Potamilus streckersoni]|uniref:Uncharacterized protein n=1 Tax=Potamilus streckersoni TaxID=2493646 RepID=A0AAE0RYW5_9BIVA|nr:hypothetical protein CHS0354_009184 [Potamilus streckersoni]
MESGSRGTNTKSQDRISFNGKIGGGRLHGTDMTASIPDVAKLRFTGAYQSRYNVAFSNETLK